jgi:hypothetical protein
VLAAPDLSRRPALGEANASEQVLAALEPDRRPPRKSIIRYVVQRLNGPPPDTGETSGTGNRGQEQLPCSWDRNNES